MKKQTIDLISSNTEKVIELLKTYLPKLVHKVQEDMYHTVGYVYENNDGSNAFVIQGSGFSEIEAWHDAYDWVNKIGQYRSTDELQMF
jgi:hypothetical protein